MPRRRRTEQDLHRADLRLRDVNWGVDAEAFAPFLYVGQCSAKNRLLLFKSKSVKPKQQSADGRGN